jgi:molybdopterin-containing oxidoreductase family iron-sulfur binding subunit
MLALFSDNYDRKPYDMVKEYWRTNATNAQDATLAAKIRELEDRRDALLQRYDSNWPEVKRIDAELDALKKEVVKPNSIATDFESSWRKWLHDGFLPNTALPTKTVAPKSDWASALSTPNTQSPTPNTYEVIFRPDPSIHDGRFANNGWLQELPKPLTKITWDNVALVSPNTAKKIGCLPPNYEEAKKGREAHVDMITLGVGDKTINKSVPVWILPGQPDDVITVHLGYGQPLSGRVGTGLGFNAYDIQQSNSRWGTAGAWVRKTGERYVIATTQLQFDMVGRDILRATPIDEYIRDKDKLVGEREEQHKENHDLSLYQDFDYKNQGNGYAWGMSIDLNSCVGCNACMIACQSENNIPIVGKEQVTRGRSMHWIRVDAYFKGDEQKPEGPYFQPVPCMHCENAPCEPVCPVHATAHSAEGLNDMVYNRCVGTRYCSNNCPYKVRRFNFLLFQDWEQPTYQLMRNPDVSVRSRGVMEKCTYCVQRIQAAKIQSELEGRPVRDGEIVTACQSVCPTEAIVFGNINDPNSKVSKLKALERDYSLLGELNTRPRTTYLSALRNPNPEIKS